MFTCPVQTDSLLKITPNELEKAREVLMATRKLKFTLKSKSITVPSMKIEYLVQFFIKLQHEKRRKWPSAKPVLAYDNKSDIVPVPGRNSRKINAAVEDIRFSITDKELALKYHEANDHLNFALEKSID